MSISLEDWHHRYTEQARWTAHLRTYLFDQAGIQHAKRILEVGCGTGAILRDLENSSQAVPFGVEINLDTALFARQVALRSNLNCADGHNLPFENQVFDITLVHFVLLWVKDPLAVVREMVRVTRSGGAVMVLAEPDYGGRLDFPQELAQIGEWQVDGLRAQGADPHIGRRLPALLRQSSVSMQQVGVLGGQWSREDLLLGVEDEWRVILSDLDSLPYPPDPVEVDRLRNLEKNARQNGDRVLFVPTFYAWGQVP